MFDSRYAEQREFERVRLLNKALSISPNGIGCLLDISKGGFAAKYIGSGRLMTREWVTNIFISNGKFYIRNIPIKFVWEEFPDDSRLDRDSTQIVGVRFCELSQAQRSQLDEFIKHNEEHCNL